MRVLVLNAGSSSLKYDVVDVDGVGASTMRGVHGVVERVGKGGAADHGAATEAALAEVDTATLDAVGYRVVHGGAALVEPAVITAAVIEQIEAARALAPLHNGPALATISAASALLGPDVPGVAVFDTAFHAAMPPRAARYAIPADLADRHGVRRYGFHGIAHRYLTERWSALSGRPLTGSKLVTLQLGNGASVTAVAGGRSIDTSMGFTPLEGLVMGTRAGDIDPATVVHLAEREGVTAAEVVGWLNTRSGLLGVSGGRSGDVRDLRSAAEAGDGAAAAAVELFCYRARKYVGAYAAALGGVDAVVFGGGIGEHQPSVRASVCEALAWAGLALDREANQAAVGVEAKVSADASTIEVWAIPVDEASAIARDVAAALAS